MRNESGHNQLREAPESWNRVTEAIIGAAIEVHSFLGPGLLERLYETALCYELQRRGIKHERQFSIRLPYKDIELGEQVLDLVVADLVVIELKSVEIVHEVHLNQLVSYMKSARLPLGLLINFNVPKLKDGLHRRILSAFTPIPPAFVS